MRRSFVVLISFIFLLISQVAWSQPFSICKNQTEVRTFRVEKTEQGKFSAIYNKYGKDQNVGQVSSSESAQLILDRIKIKLMEFGWKCKDYSTSSATNLNE